MTYIVYIHSIYIQYIYRLYIPESKYILGALFPSSAGARITLGDHCIARSQLSCVQYLIYKLLSTTCLILCSL